jgi:uncharacterized protein (DUF1810 family)
MDDNYNLQRFVDEQAPVYARVLGELRQGRKASHWMWFIFPQIAGLGSSAMAQAYAIASRDEAAAYMRHPILESRLTECARLVNEVEGRTARQIFGSPDDLKFRSSMTLFAEATSDHAVFKEAPRKYFAGVGDPLTLERL